MRAQTLINTHAQLQQTNTHTHTHRAAQIHLSTHIHLCNYHHIALILSSSLSFRWYLLPYFL